MKLNLDKSSDIPIYLQIVEHILEMIRSGELVNGEKLPTERELKNEYQISVGTVKSAYKMLAQMNKVVSVQGSGTYVTRMQTELEMAHLRSGVDQLLFQAFSAEISEEQIRDILDQEIVRFKRRTPNVHIVWICACEELLEAAVSELADMPLVKLSSFTITQVRSDPDMLKGSFDLIVTTERYYAELCQLAPNEQDHIYQVSLTMSPESVYEISRIDPRASVLLWSLEEVFERTARKRILPYHDADTLFSTRDPNPALEDLTAHQVLAVPAKTTVARHETMAQLVAAAAQSGVQVLYIHYELDRGSVLFVRTLVRNTWSNKCRNGFSEIHDNPDFHRLDAPYKSRPEL